MASIRTIFEKILELEAGTKVHVRMADETQYETTRTRLVKFWSEHKQVLTAISADDSDPLLLLGLCADFSKEDLTATFWLGVPRRKRAIEFEFYVEGEQPSTPPSQSPEVIIDSPVEDEVSSDDNSPLPGSTR